MFCWISNFMVLMSHKIHKNWYLNNNDPFTVLHYEPSFCQKNVAWVSSRTEFYYLKINKSKSISKIVYLLQYFCVILQDLPGTPGQSGQAGIMGPPVSLAKSLIFIDYCWSSSQDGFYHSSHLRQE